MQPKIIKDHKCYQVDRIAQLESHHMAFLSDQRRQDTEFQTVQKLRDQQHEQSINIFNSLTTNVNKIYKLLWVQSLFYAALFGGSVLLIFQRMGVFNTLKLLLGLVK